MDKQILIYLCNGMLLRIKMKPIIVILSNMDESEKHNMKEKKNKNPETKKYILSDSIVKSKNRQT